MIYSDSKTKQTRIKLFIVRHFSQKKKGRMRTLFDRIHIIMKRRNKKSNKPNSNFNLMTFKQS